MLEFCSGGALDDLILGKLAFGKVLLWTLVSWDNTFSEDSTEKVKKITKKSLCALNMHKVKKNPCCQSIPKN